MPAWGQGGRLQQGAQFWGIFFQCAWNLKPNSPTLYQVLRLVHPFFLPKTIFDWKKGLPFSMGAWVCLCVHLCAQMHTFRCAHTEVREHQESSSITHTISFLWNNASHWTWNLPVFQLSWVIAILLSLFPITGVTGYHVAISSFLQRCWGPRCRPHACIASIFTYGPSPFLNTGLSGVHYHTQLQDVFIFDLPGQFLGIALHAFSKSSCLSQFATHLHWSRHFKFVCLFICLGSCVVQVDFEMAI